MQEAISFASDNNSGIHKDILKAIIDANEGQYVSYGADPYTQKAKELFCKEFGNDIDVYFVLTGTGANVLGLKTVLQRYQSVISPETAHIQVDECAAPENVIGTKLHSIPTEDGKLKPEMIDLFLHTLDDEHHVQPAVVSITQSTELGTLYTIEELEALCKHAHDKGLLVHMDGARIANAAAVLNVSLRAVTRDVGVDILSFGGTKNGMMFGEAVLFFDVQLSKHFKFIRKQGMQLLSKMRFISAQFIAYLSDELWKRNAEHANTMAKRLEQKISEMPILKLVGKVEVNAVFVWMPKDMISAIQREFFFYVWDEETSVVRFMTSFNTTEEHIDKFIDCIHKHIDKYQQK